MQHIKQITEILAKETDANVIYDFFEDLFTPSEMEELNKRWHIIKCLKSGMTQRKVAEETNSSIGNISRGARELKYGHNGFHTIYDTYIK